MKGVVLKEAQIERPSTIGNSERYLVTLRYTYNKIRQEVTRNIRDSHCLKVAVFAANSWVGPEGLCPILMVFGTLPRHARAPPALDQVKRSIALGAVRTWCASEASKSRISSALLRSKSRKGKDLSPELRNLPLGLPALLFRDNSKTWEGPFPFTNTSGETACDQLRRGRKMFRLTFVNPFMPLLLYYQMKSGNKHPDPYALKNTPHRTSQCPAQRNSTAY